MANRRVSVWKYVKVGTNWRYCKPVLGANNKVKPHWVYVKGVAEQHPEGNYYIMWLEGPRKIWKLIGPNPGEATNAAEYETSRLNAIALGVPVKKEEEPGKFYGGEKFHFLESYKLSQSAASHELMEQTLQEFADFVKKNDVTKITREDLLRYKKWLVNRGRTLRTAGNKMLRVNQFLRAVLGQAEGKGLVTVKDGKFTEREPEVYTDEELDVFFKACGPFHALVFNTLLMSGLRKQEMEHLEWPDIDFSAGTLSVRGKKDWQPKDWEERTIEIPRELLEMLFSARKTRGWVFATRTGNRYTHVWDDCKEICKKAKLDETKYHPHKFRASYATTLLQSGVDLKTVQKLLGHKNLESTMRYLAKAQSPKVRLLVDAVEWKKKPTTVKLGQVAVPLDTKIVLSE